MAAMVPGRRAAGSRAAGSRAAGSPAEPPVMTRGGAPGSASPIQPRNLAPDALQCRLRAHAPAKTGSADARPTTRAADFFVFAVTLRVPTTIFASSTTHRQSTTFGLQAATLSTV